MNERTLNSKYKTPPVPEGLCKVFKIDDNTVVIEKTYKSVENISRSRVFLFPEPQTKQEVPKFLQPAKLGEVLELKSKEHNMNNIVSVAGEEVEQNQEEVRANQLITEKNDSDDNGNRDNEKTVERNEKNESGKEHEAPNEDFVMDEVAD